MIIGGGYSKLLLTKRGITKLSLSFIFFITLLLMISSSIAVISEDNRISDAELTISQSKNIYSTSSVDNMKVVSETKNNIQVIWQPVSVGLVDKEYNMTIKNLENKQKELDVDAFFSAISEGIDTLVSGSIKLSYLTDLTKTVDDYSEVCNDKQIILSVGEPNQTTKTIRSCTSQNNPKTISYKDWKAHPTSEVRDNQKQELILQKTNENGKILLLANGKLYLNLKFKTRITNRLDGTYGNDGQFGLLLDGILYHPTFNASYNKRYLINITANDALDTNYTYNITFGFTGNSTEIGSGTYTYGNVSLLACSNVHVIFNGTTELDRWVDRCNTSSFSLHIKNPVNMTRNGTLLNQIEVYYSPVGNGYQPPDEWAAIYLPVSDNFRRDINTTRWTLDNTTADGNSSWRNISGTDGVIIFNGGDDSVNDGCFRNAFTTATTFVQRNWGMDFLFYRANNFITGDDNKGYGVNILPCGGSPNSNGTSSTGARIYGDGPTQRDDIWALRTGFTIDSEHNVAMGEFNTTWIGVHINYSEFGTNRSFLHISLPQNSSNWPFNVSGMTTNSVSGALGVHFRDANGRSNYVDYARVYQLVLNAPAYTVFQENRTQDTIRPDATLNNPTNGTSNTSNNHKFNTNMSDNIGLETVTLYHNISGSWTANQTVNLSGTTNSTNFSVANIFPGTYQWNVQVCDTSGLCKQAISNFTFNVQNTTTQTVKAQSCTSEDKNPSANTYNEACDGSYPAICGSDLTNDLLSCNDGYSETQTFKKDKFTGLHIQSFNNLTNNCLNITGVVLCYRWWTNGGNLTNCTVAVDADGNASYSIVNSTCPNAVNATCPEASPTPLVVCTDVQSLENWTCNSFFGTNGTRAVARNELSTSNPGQPKVLMTDALFFNVTYITN